MKPKCQHPSDAIHGAWKYVGDKLDSASGYCTICNQQFVLDEAAGALIPGNQRVYNARKELKAALKGDEK